MVQEYKKDVVEQIAQIVKEYPIVGIVDMQGLPTPQVQNMRASLRANGIVLKMTKKRLLKRVLEKAQADKKGINELSQYLRGMPAIIFAKENPFKLFKLLKKSKSSAPAKAGNIAPRDIVVPAGPTEFAPGPIIGELGKYKIKAGIEGGKVAIKEDAVVAKEGETISAGLAGVLTRLKIEPMEIGLNLQATFEDGIIFKKDVLDVDEQAFINNITQAHQWSFNLAVECTIMNASTTDVIIGKAFKDANAVALESAFPADGVVEKLVGKAAQQANALKQITQ
ncbi:MAG: 50S ribosomal protein L10 [Candidatus Woesearchaeota archaeon]